jgi:hypothetical protein
VRSCTAMPIHNLSRILGLDAVELERGPVVGKVDALRILAQLRQNRRWRKLAVLVEVSVHESRHGYRRSARMRRIEERGGRCMGVQPAFAIFEDLRFFFGLEEWRQVNEFKKRVNARKLHVECSEIDSRAKASINRDKDPKETIAVLFGIDTVLNYSLA